MEHTLLVCRKSALASTNRAVECKCVVRYCERSCNWFLFFINGTLTANKYVQFLKEMLCFLLEEVPLC